MKNSALYSAKSLKVTQLYALKHYLLLFFDEKYRSQSTKTKVDKDK